MIGWVREPKRRRLARIEPKPELEPKFEHEFREMAQERKLSDIFYAPRSILLLCFNLLD